MIAPPESYRLILDISRTVSRAKHAVPTGIDRVELAYAEYLLAHYPDRSRFVVTHPWGGWGFVSPASARRLIETSAARWRSAGGAASLPRAETTRLLAESFISHIAMTLRQRRGSTPPCAYLLTSHHHLDQAGPIRSVIQRENARFICFIHDLIPVAMPEYARAGIADKHRRRIETVAALAHGFLVNSQSTRDALLPYVEAAGRDVPIALVPLGVEPQRPAAQVSGVGDGRPYFVCLGTIEPRKNHLLLLHLWRQLTLEFGAATPRLVIVGRRGWENENIVDLLERCTVIKDSVTEINEASDQQVQSLLGGARALLAPSFAEGYNLPLAEALAAGVPAICSDIPAHGEVGQTVPEMLDPLDGPTWRQAILDYAAPGSIRRAAQVARLGGWRVPDWQQHMQIAMALIDDVMAG